MDLLVCCDCERRFYVPGVRPSDGRRCPQCGGDFTLAARSVTSIPLDARWLDPVLAPPTDVTVVELRGKREPANGSKQRIVRDLAAYFAVRANGRSIRVSVNRGAPADAALRVAAVLDGVDADWEEHFYLPTSESPDWPGELQPAITQARRRGHLRVVASGGDRVQGERTA